MDRSRSDPREKGPSGQACVSEDIKISFVPQQRGSVSRRGRPGHSLESLLAVAVEVFIERGYDGTSMEDIAKRLGISKSAIYHHIDSKEELLALAVDRALEGIFALAEEVQQLPWSAMERLEKLVHGSVEVLMARLPYVTLLLRVRGNTETERRALERRRQFDRLVADLVAEAIKEGDLRDDIDPHVAARLIFGTVNSIVEWYRPVGDSLEKRLGGYVCAMVFNGLRVRDSQR